MLLVATDWTTRLVERFTACFHRGRRAEFVEYNVATLVGQRVFVIALGYLEAVAPRRRNGLYKVTRVAAVNFVEAGVTNLYEERIASDFMRVFGRLGMRERFRARALRTATARRAQDVGQPAVKSSSKEPETSPSYRDHSRVAEFEEIRRSGMFDAAFYEAQLKAAGQTNEDFDLVEHYVTRGEAAGIAPNPLFDPQYYIESNPDVQRAGMNALLHFVWYGLNERRNPHPLLDIAFVRQQLGPKFFGNPLTAYLCSRGARLRPHALIDPGFIWKYQRKLAPADQRPSLLFYLEQDPDLVNPSPGFDAYSYRRMYADLGGLHPLVHFARYGQAERRRIVPESESLKPGRGRIDPRKSIRGQIEAAAKLDPDVLAAFAEVAAIPVSSNYNLERAEYRLWTRLRGLVGARDFTHVILAPWLKRGGAERVIVHLARALIARDADERVLILCTTSDLMDAAGWAPLTDRVVVAAIQDVADDANNTLVAFCNFLRFIHCRHLYVVNSAFGWRLVERYGHVLRRFAAAHGFVFCYEYDEYGRRAGFAWTHLAAAAPWLSAVVSDNTRTIEQFAGDHRWRPADREAFFALPQPIDPALVGWMAEQLPLNLARAAHGRPMVLWAARADRQKGIEVTRDIAVGRRTLTSTFTASIRPRTRRRPRAGRATSGSAARSSASPTCRCTRPCFCTPRIGTGCRMYCSKRGPRACPMVATDIGGVG